MTWENLKTQKLNLALPLISKSHPCSDKQISFYQGFANKQYCKNNLLHRTASYQPSVNSIFQRKIWVVLCIFCCFQGNVIQEWWIWMCNLIYNELHKSGTLFHTTISCHWSFPEAHNVFRGYWKRAVAWNELIRGHLFRNTSKRWYALRYILLFGYFQFLQYEKYILKKG